MMESKAASARWMFTTAAFYGVCSGSMNFINKFLMTSYSFPHPGVMVLGQLVFLALTLKALEALGKVKLTTYTAQTAKSCFLLSFLYSANTVMALLALNGMNVPMYNSIRRCIPLFTLFLTYIVFTKKPTLKITASVLVITFGTILAALGDVTFDLRAYAMGFMSVLTNALHLIVLQYNGTEKKYTTIDLLYINSINCIPIMLIACLVGIDDLMKYPHFREPSFILSFTMVMISGAVLNFSMFLCTTTNSALTTNLVGVIKSAVTNIVGCFTFGGVVPTANFIAGQIINFCGGAVYVYFKYQQKVKDGNILPK